MSNVNLYIEAATRDNTRRSYRSAIKHYEVSWGGFLPATADSLSRYLSDYAQTLALSTLRQRLAALSQWHQEQGFPDPTKAPIVKKVLKGIGEIHPSIEKRAKPLKLGQLEDLISWIDQQLEASIIAKDRGALLSLSRNKALLLIGFWRGFRSDDLSRLTVDNIEVIPGEGMDIFLPRSKGDRQNQGRHFKAPALSRLCPVTAYEEWISNAFLDAGPVFRSINRWGEISDKALHTGSINSILRSLFQQAGIPDAELYSSYSLRRGFATWANENNWDVKSLMEYVGWKDVHSAMRYIETPDPFAQKQIEQNLESTPAIEKKPIETNLTVSLSIERFHKGVRGMKKTRDLIERFCLSSQKMKMISSEKQLYGITISHETVDRLDEIIDDLLHEMHEISQDNQCMLEAHIRDPSSGRIWD